MAMAGKKAQKKSSADPQRLAQTLLTLAYAVDGPNVLTGDVRYVSSAAQQIVQSMLDRATAVAGRWRLVWGPAVRTFPFSTYSDNVMMVVQNLADPLTYAICIAGTNSQSVSDWLIEDFWIYPQIPWPYGSPPDALQPKTSKGTATGLVSLQSMLPLASRPGACRLLIELLTDLVQQSDDAITLHVTGHSLGGALAPILALWLVDTQGTDLPANTPAWDPESKTTIKAHAFAGPTPGNGDFAQWLSCRLPGDRLVVVNNTLDFVPHAWCYSTMRKASKLYEPHHKPGLAMSAGIAAISRLVEPLGYTAIGVGDQVRPLQGSVKLFDQAEGGMDGFLKQIVYQHFDAYPVLLDLPDLLDTVEACQAPFLETT